ncbi:uncharacterized protein Dvir_GJ25615 [Drosophila virilis]|uniref:BPTI/Kunitz inhibitor domain-containing protein n=1 Tax=Drosophila virilis TaxID=7244 RepID=A0A0Q9WAQ6_DROVI|nr:uncharacterized protein Dvir_GJ25615 [Drosophila virilis]
MKFSIAIFLICGLLKIILGQERPARCFEKPSDHGQCFDGRESWTYYFRINQCKIFTYNGCKGNNNRFPTLRNCEKYCKLS